GRGVGVGGGGGVRQGVRAVARPLAERVDRLDEVPGGVIGQGGDAAAGVDGLGAAVQRVIAVLGARLRRRRLQVGAVHKADVVLGIVGGGDALVDGGGGGDEDAAADPAGGGYREAAPAQANVGGSDHQPHGICRGT